jgi:hypothetical protein
MRDFFSGSLSWDLAAKVAIGLIGLVVPSISFIKWWSNKRSEAKAQKHEDEITALGLEMQRQQIAGMRAMAYCYELMDDMVDKEDGCCDRVVVFNGHNGGMLPDPGRPYYVSAIHSSFGEGRSHDKRPEALYRKILVDTYYVNMLLECYEKKWVLLDTLKMPDSLLRDFYLSEGVTQSLVFFLKTSGHSFVFGSTSTVGRSFSESELRDNYRMMNLMRTSMTHITRSTPY